MHGFFQFELYQRNGQWQQRKEIGLSTTIGCGVQRCLTFIFALAAIIGKFFFDLCPGLAIAGPNMYAILVANMIRHLRCTTRKQYQNHGKNGHEFTHPYKVREISIPLVNCLYYRI